MKPFKFRTLPRTATFNSSGLKSKTTSSNFPSTKQFRLRIETSTSMALGPVGCYQNNYLLSSKFLPLSLFCFKGLGIRQARVLIADAYLHFREPPLLFSFVTCLDSKWNFDIMGKGWKRTVLKRQNNYRSTNTPCFHKTFWKDWLECVTSN